MGTARLHGLSQVLFQARKIRDPPPRSVGLEPRLPMQETTGCAPEQPERALLEGRPGGYV